MKQYPGRTKYSLWIFSDLLEKARKLAIKKRTSVSHVVNKAIEKYLKGES